MFAAFLRTEVGRVFTARVLKAGFDQIVQMNDTDRFFGPMVKHEQRRDRKLFHDRDRFARQGFSGDGFGIARH